MNTIINRKWFIFITWIVLTIGLFFAAPNMADLVREKGQITVPDDYSSSIAGEMTKEIQSQKGGGDETQVALVFHGEKKLTESEIAEAEKAINLLEEQKEELGITEVLTHFNEGSLKDQLVSDDGKAILASINISWKDREAEELSEALYATLAPVKVDHHFTSEWMINEDLMKSSEEGLKKTEGITVVFILAVLLLVFRSAVAPLIPLLTVGFSYLASQSIVSILVDQFNFPISNYTQIFLVAILFGIGTDYCILLLSRYKEELSQTDSIQEAIAATYKNAGRTVFFSGVAVMIGFAAIGFSQFILYQSAAAVAIGVAILLVALFTIVPFFMMVLGRKLFWPAKGKIEHGESRIWGMAGRFSLSRPLIALLIVAVVCVPFLVTYDGELSYDSLEEISGDVNSIKAFNAIADSFGPGESMPTQIVIKNDEELNTVEYLNIVEKISSEIEQIELVQTVRSATRPTGETIDDFFVANQAETLESGLDEGKDGLDQISAGLNEASNELTKSEPELSGAEKGINDLIDGTNEIHTGLKAVQANLATIEDGIRQGSAGSEQIKAGLDEAKSAAEGLLSAYEQLLDGYNKTQTGMAGLISGYEEIGNGLMGLSQKLDGVSTGLFSYVEGKHPDLNEDGSYVAMKGELQSIQKSLNPLAEKMQSANAGLKGVQSGLAAANENLQMAIAGQREFPAGLQQLINGIDEQQQGLNQLADGQGEILANFPQLTNGLNQVTGGQEQLLAGFSGLGNQMNELTSGLKESSDGLNQVSSGLGSAQDYLSGLSTYSDGFYIPEEVLQSEDFAQVLDTYLSDNRKIMTLDVIFEASPYSNETMAKIEDIQQSVERVTKGTKLENAEVAIGGITSTNIDLDTMSSQDYSRTVVLMLAGISLILIFLFRSLIMPIYIIGSLILTYYTSMGVNEVIYVHIFGYTGISWAVPFFAFVILIALGVDYSIFLMDRFNEYKDMSVAEAMLLSMKKMGTVIISAAIILGGTFAAMMPSGMLSLLQIASIVIVGLLLYSIVILPLFIPVMVKNFGAANWWPFKR
ncbi:MMPL family transporter [Cytobacillus purgationiresistens]|uniref:RND superfamily putative drug exporter n=1 Tax=Cytobacillus purgationiresistens TaxID=863449 RepID=A0ABU0ARF2_9BACI|nr:MMPL family transporter [Cytobacillus purgationiresistens]MDQ0272630.1 RND superfamily putative drug exporter [Cytobacillus purgationiresistens]